jgi:hypothetical protein
MPETNIEMPLSLPLIHWVHVLNTLDRFKDLDEQADRIREELRTYIKTSK